MSKWHQGTECVPGTVLQWYPGMAAGKEAAHLGADSTALIPAATGDTMWDAMGTAWEPPVKNCPYQKMRIWAKLLACERYVFATRTAEWRRGCKK